MCWQFMRRAQLKKQEEEEEEGEERGCLSLMCGATNTVGEFGLLLVLF